MLIPSLSASHGLQQDLLFTLDLFPQEPFRWTQHSKRRDSASYHPFSCTFISSIPHSLRLRKMFFSISPYAPNSEGLCSSDKRISSLIVAAQLLRWVFGLDPHSDPHGETSGRKQWRQGRQRALISEQKVLKTFKNRCSYSFSTIRNQQVAGSSPATSSRNR